jgi:hypothetical protein
VGTLAYGKRGSHHAEQRILLSPWSHYIYLSPTSSIRAHTSILFSFPQISLYKVVPKWKKKMAVKHLIEMIGFNKKSMDNYPAGF